MFKNRLVDWFVTENDYEEYELEGTVVTESIDW